MKYIYLIIVTLFLISCGNTVQKESKESESDKNSSQIEGLFGKALSTTPSVSISELPSYLAEKDEIQIKVSGEIEAVCKMEGCWLEMDLANGQLIHVTFKDEAFVVDKNLAGKNATIEGVAQKEIIPVDYLKRMAESEGKSQEEIDAITEAGVEYTFVASGVLIED